MQYSHLADAIPAVFFDNEALDLLAVQDQITLLERIILLCCKEKSHAINQLNTSYNITAALVASIVAELYARNWIKASFPIRIKFPIANPTAMSN